MLTAAELERRKGFLTASDLPAVFGLHQRKSGGDLQYEKIMELSDQKVESEAIDLGDEAEPICIKHIEKKLGIVMVRNMWRVAPNGVIAATHDGLSMDETIGGEAKSSGVFNPWLDLSQWGEPGTDEVPPHVLIQVFGQQISCPTIKTTYVPVVLGGRVGIQLFVIPRDDANLAVIEIEALRWWKAHVIDRLPVPVDQIPSIETLKRVPRIKGKVIELSAEGTEWLRQIHGITQQMKTMTEMKEDYQARIGLELGDAEEATSLIGKVTFKITNNKGYTVEPFSYRSVRFWPNKAFKATVGETAITTGASNDNRNE